MDPNPIYPIVFLAAVAVIASLLSAHYQRKEKVRREREEGELWLSLTEDQAKDLLDGMKWEFPPKWEGR